MKAKEQKEFIDEIYKKYSIPLTGDAIKMIESLKKEGFISSNELTSSDVGKNCSVVFVMEDGSIQGKFKAIINDPNQQ